MTAQKDPSVAQIRAALALFGGLEAQAAAHLGCRPSLVRRVRLRRAVRGRPKHPTPDQVAEACAMLVEGWAPVDLVSSDDVANAIRQGDWKKHLP